MTETAQEKWNQNHSTIDASAGQVFIDFHNSFPDYDLNKPHQSYSVAKQK